MWHHHQYLFNVQNAGLRKNRVRAPVQTDLASPSVRSTCDPAVRMPYKKPIYDVMDTNIKNTGKGGGSNISLHQNRCTNRNAFKAMDEKRKGLRTHDYSPWPSDHRSSGELRHPNAFFAPEKTTSTPQNHVRSGAGPTRFLPTWKWKPQHIHHRGCTHASRCVIVPQKMPHVCRKPPNAPADSLKNDPP